MRKSWRQRSTRHILCLPRGLQLGQGESQGHRVKEHDDDSVTILLGIDRELTKPAHECLCSSFPLSTGDPFQDPQCMPETAN